MNEFVMKENNVEEEFAINLCLQSKTWKHLEIENEKLMN